MAKTVFVEDPNPLISVARMNSGPGPPRVSTLSAAYSAFSDPTHIWLLENVSVSRFKPCWCAAGDLQTQNKYPGTNEKNKSLEREIIFKGSGLT